MHSKRSMSNQSHMIFLFYVDRLVAMLWPSLEAPEHMYLIESIGRDLPPQAVEVARQ
jgi:hypothetical protein